MVLIQVKLLYYLCWKVCQALLLSLSALSLRLVCEEDGTEVDSDEFLMTLPDNVMLMALESGETWKPQPVRCDTKYYLSYSRKCVNMTVDMTD